MAQKNKVEFTLKIDEEQYKKMIAAADAEGMTPNNYLLHLIRTNVAYHERIHGRIDTSKISLPSPHESED